MRGGQVNLITSYNQKYMRNPEEAFLSGLSQKLRTEKLFQKTEAVLSENPPLNPENFRDLYGDENVDKDIAYVKNLEKKFSEETNPENEEAKKLAKSLETIITEQIELSDWMGPDAVTITTSRFDDIANGVDLVTEFQNQKERTASHLALAVDVTFGSGLGKKMARIINEIRSGELARVKYFESEFLNIRGELRNVPRVVVGIDTHTLGSLGEVWLAHDTKVLARHGVQRAILEEIRAELAAFQKYALHVKQKNVALVYERALGAVEGILAEKKEIELGELVNDKVFQSVLREASLIGEFRRSR